jgi:hypothetical protein
MTIQEEPWAQMTTQLLQAQQKHQRLMNQWKSSHKATESTHDGLLYLQNRIIVPPEEELKRTILRCNHDAPTAGHPGRDRTIQQIERIFWWPDLCKWVTEYVKGCATCQQNKSRTHPTRPSPYQIMTKDDTLPFQMIAMDLITNLPKSQGYNVILTIVDHGCT